MSDPNLNQNNNQNILQNEIQHQQHIQNIQQVQPIGEQQQLYYNSETKQWYDAFGRVVYSEQNNVQPQQNISLQELKQSQNFDFFDEIYQFGQINQKIKLQQNQNNGRDVQNNAQSKEFLGENQQIKYETKYQENQAQKRQQNIEKYKKEQEKQLKQYITNKQNQTEINQKYQQNLKSVALQEAIKEQQQNKKSVPQIKIQQDLKLQNKIQNIKLSQEQNHDYIKQVQGVQIQLSQQKLTKIQVIKQQEKKKEKKQQISLPQYKKIQQVQIKKQQKIQPLKQDSQGKKQEQQKKVEKKLKKQKKQKKSKKSKEDLQSKQMNLSEVSNNASKKAQKNAVDINNPASKVGNSGSQPQQPPAQPSNSANLPPPPVSIPQNVPIQQQLAVQQPTQLQPVLIIKQAQKQRISNTLNIFNQYTLKHKLHINNQKAVYFNIYQQIDRRKSNKNILYSLIKQYLNQYQNLARNFHENSYKIQKQEKIINLNKLLNMSQDLKKGTDQLIFLRKQAGNQYHRFNQFIGTKVFSELQIVFNKFFNQMSRAQAQCNDKKKKSLDLEESYKKNLNKLAKIYNRGKQGKQQDQDVFVETCKFIQLQKQFRISLILWGKGVIELRKIFINCQQKLNQQTQAVLNTFKTSQSGLYSFHPAKFEKIIISKEQIIRQTKYPQLCALADSDYIKYTLQVIKKPITQVLDKDFQYFTQMPHFQTIVGKSTDLLKGMINKSFLLKQKNEQLINTISGNLVHFNRETSGYKDKFIVKNLIANIVSEGVIQFDEMIPGIIFNESRTIRLSFKDQDRAEELICLLNQKI